MTTQSQTATAPKAELQASRKFSSFASCSQTRRMSEKGRWRT
jgi:hypothetical protein